MVMGGGGEGWVLDLPDKAPDELLGGGHESGGPSALPPLSLPLLQHPLVLLQPEHTDTSSLVATDIIVKGMIIPHQNKRNHILTQASSSENDIFPSLRICQTLLLTHCQNYC
jgi:hypothetical protein